MANLNKVLLMGNLTRDPEVRYLPSGTPVVEIGLAVNRTSTDKQSGERREETTYVDCKAFGRAAENIGRFFQKGRPIFIEGRLEFRSWEAKDGSGKRSKLDVFIENWQFVGGRGEGGEGGGGGGAQRGGYRDDGASQGGAPRQAAPPQRQDFGGGDGGIVDDDVPF